MAEPLHDVDLDALAPRPIRAKLAGKTYRLPGDMPLDLFFRIQAFEQRVDSGESEMVLLGELKDEVLGLFQVHQPTMKSLPAMGVLTLMGALGAIYSGGGARGEAQAQAATRPPSRKRTPSAKPARRARPRTSR